METLEKLKKLYMLSQAMVANFQLLKGDEDFTKEIPDFKKKAYAAFVPLMDFAKEVETVYFRKCKEVEDGEVSLREK